MAECKRGWQQGNEEGIETREVSSQVKRPVKKGMKERLELK
jgi:hypothetical protein